MTAFEGARLHPRHLAPTTRGFSPGAKPQKSPHSTKSQTSSDRHSRSPGQSPLCGFSPLNLPYGLFALEGLAFWETPSPSNYHRFALLPEPLRSLSLQRRPPAKRLNFQSQPTSPQLSKSTTVRSIPQTERATNNPPQINIITASLRVATPATKHNVENLPRNVENQPILGDRE